MKKLFIILAIATAFYSCSTELTETETEQESRPQNTTTENLIVITLDGLRWQEVFEDADVFDRDYLSTIGNLYGNRNLGNKVNVANPTNISYPGYHEIFTGNTTGIVSNNHTPNPHKTVFQDLNEKGLSISVSSLSVFSVLLFRPDITTFPIYYRNSIYQNNQVYSYDLETMFSNETIQNQNLLPIYKDALIDFENLEDIVYIPENNNADMVNIKAELLLHSVGKNIMKHEQPNVMYFYYAITDSFGHEGKWERYTGAARNVGVYIKDLIGFVGNHPQYANNTTILITTDHGRGETDWKRHGNNVIGSDETWFIVISPYTNKGIVDEQKQYYNEQLAQTMAGFLGFTYEAEHEIAEAIEL